MGTKVSELSAASALTGTEIVPVVQSSTSLKATATQVKTFVRKNVQTALTSAAGVVNIDLSLGDYFTITLTENVTSLTFTNLDGSGYGRSIMLQITQHASSAKTFAFPSSFKWAGGTLGIISTGLSAVDVVAVTTFNNGSAWRATLAKAFA